MMLIITDHITPKVSRQYNWHIGEPFPYLRGSVVIFQADCDELQLILEALRRERNEDANVD